MEEKFFIVQDAYVNSVPAPDTKDRIAGGLGLPEGVFSEYTWKAEFEKWLILLQLEKERTRELERDLVTERQKRRITMSALELAREKFIKINDVVNKFLNDVGGD